MHHPFFPNPVFGWVFVLLLLSLLALAAVIDIRTARIPKPLTISIAVSGLMINGIRGCWLGSLDLEVWELGKGSVWLGGLDGFLFSVVGLLFAFIVFFGMYLLGSCGGGDVKLCAAIGAWIGAIYTIFLLFATVVTLVIWIVGKIALGGTRSLKQAQKARVQLKNPKANAKSKELPRGRMTFSLPAAVAAAMVMFWVFRVDLQLTPPPPAPETEAKNASIVATKS